MILFGVPKVILLKKGFVNIRRWLKIQIMKLKTQQIIKIIGIINELNGCCKF